MITEIKIDKDVIFLTSNNSVKLFSVDSLSLIIGNNGTGKTQILKKIVQQFVQYHQYEFMVDDSVQIEFSDGPFLSCAGRFGIIYFSPTPSRPKFIKSNNFIDASPNWNNPLTVFDLVDYSKYINEFGLSPKVFAIKSINIRRILNFIVQILRKNVKKIDKRYLTVNYKLNEVIYRWRQDDNEMEEEDVFFVMYLIYEKLQGLYRNDINRLFSFLCVIDNLLKLRKLDEEFCIKLLDHLFDDNPNDFFMDGPLDFMREVGLIYDFLSCFRIRAVNSNDEGLDEWPALKTRLYDEISFGQVKVDAQVDVHSKFEIDSFGVWKYFDFEFKNMSSGQFALLTQMVRITQKIQTVVKRGYKSILLLIDEGDAFLHLSWQRKYINLLNNMLGLIKSNLGLDNIQVILATHSPLLATDVPKEYICRLGGEGRVLSAFAAPLHVLLNESFGTSTVGEFAIENIKQTVERLEKIITKSDLSLKDSYIINSIDNPVIKNNLKDRIPKK